jgi:Protein of unknown function (DUF2637)
VAAIRLTRTHRILIGIVVAGAVMIAGIGFAGSYSAVRTLALHKGFGWFANVFPIGVDAGIVVLLALDLLLTWLRIPFPLLRQTAWLLTAATIAFNGAAAWPDPLGVGMHAIIPVLFVVSVEAARHAIGRIADITADKHMEGVRLTRWILAPVPTFRLWRRMKLWELRSYEEVIRREQDRLVYRARLRARYGTAWRRRAPIEAIMPLRLARYGVPLSETADAGLAAAGIEVQPAVKQLAPAPEQAGAQSPARAPVQAAAEEAVQSATQGAAQAPDTAQLPLQAQPQDLAAQTLDPAARIQGPAAQGQAQARFQQPAPRPAPVQDPFTGQPVYGQQVYGQPYDPRDDPRYAQYGEQAYEAFAYDQQWQGAPHDSPWFAAPPVQPEQIPGQIPGQMPQQVPQRAQQPQQSAPGPQQEPIAQVMVPAGPNRSRPLGGAQLNGGGAQFSGMNGANGTNGAGGANGVTIPGPRAQEPVGPTAVAEAFPEPFAEPAPEPEPLPSSGLDLPDGIPVEEAYFSAYRQYVHQHSNFPNARQFARFLPTIYGGTAPEERELVTTIRDMRYRFTSESDTEHIP